MSRFHSRFLEILAAGAAIAAASLAFAPAAGAQENSVELVAGASYYSNDYENEFDFSSWGLRFTHDFSDRWGIEVAYLNQDQDILQAEIYEASARFTFFQNERVRVYAFAGAGVLSYDYTYEVGGDAYTFGSDDTAILNSGIAADIFLGERFYLRPDLRERFALDIFGPYDDSSSEATLAFGYRF